MRKLIITTALIGSGLSACETPPPFYPEVDFKPAFKVEAAFETPVMASIGDSADDPAIYINGETGFIAGTDKQSGLYIYNLDGSERDYMPIGMVNNVDLREGFGTSGAVLLVTSDDEMNQITALTYDPETEAFSAPQNLPITPSPYGVCLGIVDGAFHVGATTKGGYFHQYEISEGSDGLELTPIRDIFLGLQTEGCVFDDRTSTVYMAEEVNGLYAYPANPADGDTHTLIARPNQYGISADLEGVTIYEDGEDGGYLIQSSQGNSSFVVFNLPDLTFAGRFEIVEGETDRVSVTDGIAATSTPTAQFPNGFFIAQDNQNDESTPEDQEKQNFKVVDWRDIEAGLNR